MGSKDGKLLECVFFSIFPKKMKDGEEGWQTIGVALSLVDH
jgi:hypothetical protein